MFLHNSFVPLMRFSSGLSRHPETSQAVGEAADIARAGLAGEEPDLVLLFVTSHHADQFADLPLTVAAHFPRALLLGCSAGGVVGSATEVERAPGLSMTLASLPGVDLRPFHVEDSDVPMPERAPLAWRQRLGLPPLMTAADDARPTPIVVLPEPFSVRIERLLRSLDAAFPDGVKVGGAASGGTRPGTHALWLGPRLFRRGAVGVALRGNLAVDGVVAQGCKALGTPMLVTRSQGNVILELDGRTPLDVIRSLAADLSAEDLELAKAALFVGIEMEPDRVEYGHGDFLVRQIAEVDQTKGWMSLGTKIAPWQVVQFHVRDGKTSAADLRRMLERYRSQQTEGDPQGALLFSCVGRGENLYGAPNQESRIIEALVPGVPLGGFFCNGEIGKAGKATALHGLTASLALFRDPGEPAAPPQWQVRGAADA